MGDDEWVGLIARTLVPVLDDSVEHLVVWDADARLLAHEVGEQDQVRLPRREGSDWSGSIMAHSHPWIAERPLGGMTPPDVFVLSHHRAASGAVVYRWLDRVYVQWLEPGPQGWPADEGLADHLQLTLITMMAVQRQRRVAREEDASHLALERLATQLRLSYKRIEVGL